MMTLLGVLQVIEEIERVLGVAEERPVMMDIEWIMNFKLNLPVWLLIRSF